MNVNIVVKRPQPTVRLSVYATENSYLTTVNELCEISVQLSLRVNINLGVYFVRRKEKTNVICESVCVFDDDARERDC